jgi:Na+-driven multidrug efflux pump
MRVLLRRFLAMAALFFWQGGFTFYAAVVVPVAQEVLGHLRQGFVTRQVTVYLNLSGAIALVVLAWDLLVARDPSRWRRIGRRALWASMVLTLVGLYVLHPRLDALLQARGRIILDSEAFRPLHRLYLWVQTVQWSCAVAYLLLTLWTWRAEDQRGSPVALVPGAEQEREEGAESGNEAEGKKMFRR